jgi:hypothetical protein
VFPVRYEMGFYMQEDGILHSHRRENLKSYESDRYVLMILSTILAVASDYTVHHSRLYYSL